MSRTFELFGDPADLEKLRSEYENWEQKKHIGAFEAVRSLKKCSFWPLGMLVISRVFLALGVSLRLRKCPYGVSLKEFRKGISVRAFP